MAEAKVERDDRGPRAAKVWAAWAVLFVLSAVVFAWCFHRTYYAVMDRAFESFVRAFDKENSELTRRMGEGASTDSTWDALQKATRRLRRLSTYSMGYIAPVSLGRNTYPFDLAANRTTLLLVLLSVPVVLLLLRFARAGMQLGSLDNDERTFQLRMVMWLAVPLLVLAAAAGALAAAGLSGTRLLQIHYQADFNDSMVPSELITYHRDYLGRGLATLISCAAMLAIVAWGLYPFFARRTLKQLGRCPKCAYPRGDKPTCPECGSSHA
ncbi:MAG TPA: hypothetical protein VK157_02790 [Phycisphaerales bacterium]|nr:hypothetical protein [Phycisphaerales bacterium]